LAEAAVSKTPGSMGGPVGGGAASSLLATGAAYGGVVECHLPPQANSLLIKLTAALDAGTRAGRTGIRAGNGSRLPARSHADRRSRRSSKAKEEDALPHPLNVIPSQLGDWRTVGKPADRCIHRPIMDVVGAMATAP
jgi:hypothetical protein